MARLFAWIRRLLAGKQRITIVRGLERGPVGFPHEFAKAMSELKKPEDR